MHIYWPLLLALGYALPAFGLNVEQLPCICERGFRPVCGTNGKTYNNICKLNCATRASPDLRLAYKGTCCPKPFCHAHKDPLCDNHGHTHHNECMFRYMYCVMRKSDSTVLSITKKGVCEESEGLESCNDQCPEEVDQVCDAGQKVYKNLCLFHYEDCMHRRRGGQPLVLAYKGECSGLFTTTVRPTTEELIELTTFAELPPTLSSVEEYDLELSIGKSPKEQEILTKIESQTTEEQETTTVTTPIVQAEFLKPLPPKPLTTEEPEPTAYASPEPEPAPESTAEPEPTAEATAEPEPTAEVTAEPEPILEISPDVQAEFLKTLSPKLYTTAEPEPEPTAYASSEPEPTATPEQQPVVVSSAEPEPTAEVTTEPEPTVEVTAEPEPTAEVTAEPEPTAEVTAEPEPTAEVTAEPEPTEEVTAEPEPTAEVTAEPELTAEVTAEPKPTAEVTAEPEPTAEVTAEPEPTAEVTAEPQPTAEVRAEPEPTAEVTAEPEPASESTPEPEPTAEVTAEYKLPTPKIELSIDATPETMKLTSDYPLPALLPVITQPKSPICSAMACTKQYLPVCDTRWKTHKNPCIFQFQSCLEMQMHGKEIAIAYEGLCESAITTTIETPVTSSTVCTAMGCTKEVVQVCDQFGSSYVNECVFEFKACLALQREGMQLVDTPCQTPTADACSIASCTTEYNPVCDNRGQTHDNTCIFEYEACVVLQNHGSQLYVVRNEPCQETSVTETPEVAKTQCARACDRTYRPLCDNNGETHPNLCEFEIRQCYMWRTARLDIHVLFDGDCEEMEKHLTRPTHIPPVAPKFECPTAENHQCEQQQYSPVCDSQRKTHKNLCYYNIARCEASKIGLALTLEYEGECIADDCVEDDTCPDDIDEPICAGDMKTYPNKCYFKLARCRTIKTEGKYLEVLFHGECSECLQDCGVTAENAPEEELVCVEETGDTQTACEVEMVKCIYEKQNNNATVTVTVLHKGRCCTDESSCPLTEDPVCDTTGSSHRNKCYFNARKCMMENTNGVIIDIEYEGECGFPKQPQFEPEIPAQTPAPRLCPSECPDVFDPVCDNKGKTHSNECHLKVEQCRNPDTQKSYKGQCCQDMCLPGQAPKNYQPICDSNGHTHASWCEFGMHRCFAMKRGENLNFVGFGVCATSPCRKNCTLENDPVCGTDGRTYINICRMQEAFCIGKSETNEQEFTLAHQGECCDQTPCPYEHSPVCDNRGHTHINRCVFEQAKCTGKMKGEEEITIEHSGSCCTRPCTKEYMPVCDGTRTYNNLCEFQVYQCDAQRKGHHDVSMAYPGECCQKELCDEQEPLCDTDKMTHMSLCDFHYQQCLVKMNENRTLDLLYEGECCPLHPCNETYTPVCDIDGKTHHSECHFQNAKCAFDRMNKHNGRVETLEMAYRGECCQKGCENTWEPVCDQHGKLYQNECDFEIRKCEADKTDREMLLKMPCPPRRQMMHRRHLNET